MKFEPVEIVLKRGDTLVLRNADICDAELLVEYLRRTCGETSFLARDPDELDFLTIDSEKEYISGVNDSKRAAMIVGFINGEHVGNCSVDPVGSFRRVEHRCSFGIAIYEKFWGMGIGEAFIRKALELAKCIGYELMELEVNADNERAISLYRKLGFEEFGRRPSGIKYHAGRYVDDILMARQL